MSDNFGDNETYNNTINSQNNDFSSGLLYNSPFEEFLRELLQEVYIIFINSDIEDTEDIENIKLNEVINNLLLDNDIDAKDVHKIMTSDPPFNYFYYFYYSSLIGFFYQQGIGCEIDKIKAFEIFSNVQFSFNQEDIFRDNIKKLNEIVLQYFYSLFLYRDVIVNGKNSHKLQLKNAEKGDPVSQYFIGNCYYHGKNIKKDHNMAIEWYSKSSEGGNIKAMYMLGNCYFSGAGVVKDEKKAFELYLKSAEGGYRHALVKMGSCYLYGDGTLKDGKKAFEWHLKAAKKGDRHCQYLVANYYNDGKYVPKNEEKGFYWNRKAAINGEVNAQCDLAKYYLNHSINNNERRAFNWYLNLANKKSSARAKYLVAKCYRDGIGTKKDFREAAKWFVRYSPRVSPNSSGLREFLIGSS